MKKTVLAFFSLAVMAVSAQAQSFNLGVKLGALGTKIDGESFEKGYKLSYQGGAFAELDLGKIGIQPELLFSQTSSKTVSGPTSTSTVLSPIKPNMDLKLSYLSIPILLRYNFAKMFTINLGPQFSILMNKNSDLSTNGQEAFKGGDVAGVVGLQVHISSLRVYGRYVFGLSDINKVSSVTNSEKWKTQQLEVGVGLKVF